LPLPINFSRLRNFIALSNCSFERVFPGVRGNVEYRRNMRKVVAARLRLDVQRSRECHKFITGHIAEVDLAQVVALDPLLVAVRHDSFFWYELSLV
jgi:hypothetical protein